MQECTASLVHTTDIQRLCRTEDFSILPISHQSSEHENAFYNHPRQNEASERRNGFHCFPRAPSSLSFCRLYHKTFIAFVFPHSAHGINLFCLFAKGGLAKLDRLIIKKRALLGLSYLEAKLFSGSMFGWISFELLLSFHYID